MNAPFIPPPALTTNRDTAPAFWMVDILWIPLLEGKDTGGAFSVIEQWMRGGSGAFVPHVHSIDEWFFVIEGEMTTTVSGETSVAKAGDSLWIPRGTVHSFKVTSDVAHVLNGYTPAGFEQVIKGLAKPAERRELPPPTDEKPDPEIVAKIFNNYWTVQADAPWAQPPPAMRSPFPLTP